MADTTTEFPVEYLEALDEVLELESFSSKYDVAGAEFATHRSVKVPRIEFDGGAVDYDRFQTEGTMSIEYDVYQLDSDKQKVFYVDAVDDADTAAIQTSKGVAEWERTLFVPDIDKHFFEAVADNAGTTGTTTLTADNIKEELRKARVQMVNNGVGAADLYMSADALAALEDAIDRQFAGEGTITDTVGQYNMFTIYLVPDDRLAGIDFAVIAPGAIRYVKKRSVSYLFAPGQHTHGDGYLTQMRWVYGPIVWENKKPLIYVNAASGDTSNISTVSAAKAKAKATA